MLYGLLIFPTEYTVQPAELARRAEDLGFESLWFPEHTHIPVERRSPWPGGPELPREYYHSYDPFVACTAAATATRNLKVATGVCLVVEHDPIVMAKQVATLDRVSDGRFVFGIGGGWNFEEMENHGTNPKTRFRLLRERVLAMKALWTEDKPEFHGKFVDFDAVHMNPKPVQKPHPPIIMGGDGATTFDRVIEFCDGWMPIARGSVPAGLAGKVKDLRARAEASGRDPSSFTVSLFGCPPEREAIEEVEQMGLDRVILGLPARSPEEVWPILNERAKLVR